MPQLYASTASWLAVCPQHQELARASERLAQSNLEGDELRPSKPKCSTRCATLGTVTERRRYLKMVRRDPLG